MSDGDLWRALSAPATPLEVWDGERFAAASWDRCASGAERVAAGLRRQGVEPGTRVACVLSNSYDALAGLLGIWLAGAVVVSLPAPARAMSLDVYGEQLTRLSNESGARILLVERQFVDVRAPSAGAGITVVPYEDLPAGGPVEPLPPRGEAVAFIQYSSGSTGTPKGCVLSARAIVTHVQLLGETLGIGPGDRGVSWLPLSHDMGLFGALLMGWIRGMRGRVATPQRFLASPRTWMNDCADWDATFTVTPNFGLRIASRAARRTPPSGSFPLRACIIGSDRIEWSALEETADVLGPYGMTMKTFSPAYGLAEATLAVTATRPDETPHALAVDPDAMLTGEVRESADASAARRLVSCGRPLDGVEVRIDSDTEGALGEIVVRSPTLANGYVDEKQTASRFVDGEFRTGDLGFLRDGELYVVGRNDDMMSIGGRNISAIEIEAELVAQPGVRSGNCAVLDHVDGDRTRVVVLLEPEQQTEDYESLAKRLRAVVTQQAGLGVSEFAFVPRGSIPKSPSGKIQRHRCRQLVASLDQGALARVRFD